MTRTLFLCNPLRVRYMVFYCIFIGRAYLFITFLGHVLKAMVQTEGTGMGLLRPTPKVCAALHRLRIQFYPRESRTSISHCGQGFMGTPLKPNSSAELSTVRQKGMEPQPPSQHLSSRAVKLETSNVQHARCGSR